jgi:hypothetical protein
LRPTAETSMTLGLSLPWLSSRELSVVSQDGALIGTMPVIVRLLGPQGLLGTEELMSSRVINHLENLRNRLLDLVNGDENVDIGTLLYLLNLDIGELGGNKIELKPHEIRSRFFSEKED